MIKFLSIVPAIITPIFDIFKGKQEIKKAVTLAKLDKVQKGQASNIELDKIEREGSKWKRDISFLVFLLPAILCFYPPALPHIQAGFTALGTMPQWYQLSLGLMLVSAWGYRQLICPLVELLFTKKT